MDSRDGEHMDVGYCAAVNCRLRSANRGNSNNVWNVNTAGYLNNNNASNSYRSQPDRAILSAAWSVHSTDRQENIDTRSRNPCQYLANNTILMRLAFGPVPL